MEGQYIDWYSVEVASMPERVSNNAVIEGSINENPYVFSFGGIDSTKIWSGIHLRSFRYNVMADIWDTIPSLPDNMGKIAAAASNVNNKIYIIGGYHVLQNGNEISSDKVHIYDPETNTYLPDGAPIPVPIDDHVQAVWKDSLIFVVTGWSNSQNVANVQIYNPSTDTWLAGTSVPNTSHDKVFGASGIIIGDTLYYSGGAANGGNFPPTSSFRKGYIDPSNPTNITWVTELNAEARGYRMAVALFGETAYWFGGSDHTYNYNGIAYNGSGGVEPQQRFVEYNIWNGELRSFSNGSYPAIMDLRGIGGIRYNSNNSFYEYIIAGGMTYNQEVTNKTIKLLPIPTSTHQQINYQTVDIFPNPAQSFIQIKGIEQGNVKIFSTGGKIVLEKSFSKGDAISVKTLSNGVYEILIQHDDEFSKGRFMIAK